MADVRKVRRAWCKLCGYVWEPGAEDQDNGFGGLVCPACHDGKPAVWSAQADREGR